MDLRRDSPDSSTHHRSNKDKATFEAQIPNLPEEIMSEILARLPVKSLLRFRCVSKSWNHEPCTDAFSIDYPKKHSIIPARVVGSCNGLICLAFNRKDLFLWNPSTRKSKKLPPANANIELGLCNVYGCGLYESHDDYKIVGILCESGNAGAFVSMAKTYSLKTNSWKRTGDFKGGVPMDDMAKFACGKLHWRASSKLILNGWDIVSLDIESEVLGIVEQPNYGEGELVLTLGVMGECICVLCSYQISADLWVLKEYGVKESWTKVATVPYLNTSWKWHSQPLFMLRNGEILLVFGMRFVVYNPKDNSFRIHEISNLKYFWEAVIYVESLVSPVANGR